MKYRTVWRVCYMWAREGSGRVFHGVKEFWNAALYLVSWRGGDREQYNPSLLWPTYVHPLSTVMCVRVAHPGLGYMIPRTRPTEGSSGKHLYTPPDPEVLSHAITSPYPAMGEVLITSPYPVMGEVLSHAITSPYPVMVEVLSHAITSPYPVMGGSSTLLLHTL